MKVTNLTRTRLACRRQARNLMALGYEEVGERGGRLWELYRGGRTDHIITDVKVAVGGKSLFVRTEKVPCN